MDGRQCRVDGSVRQLVSYRITFHIATEDKAMLVVLDGKTVVSLLVEMAQAAGVVTCVVAHRVRTTDPSHEPAHHSMRRTIKNDEAQ